MIYKPLYSVKNCKDVKVLYNLCIEREREGKTKHCLLPSIYVSFQYQIHSKAHRNTSSIAASWPRGPNTAACPQRSSRRRSPHRMASWSLINDKCRPKKHPQHKKSHIKKHGCCGANKILAYMHLLNLNIYKLFHILSPIPGIKGECGTILGLKHPMRCDWKSYMDHPMILYTFKKGEKKTHPSNF